MNSLKLAAAVSVLSLLIYGGPALGQQGKIQVEAWEVRINERQPIAKVMEAMGVRAGMVIGEVGAGTGRVTVWLADAVGPKGLIYANDIDAGALDIAFMTNTYHHLAKPVELVCNLLPTLKENGRLVIVERDPVRSPHKHEATAREDFIKQMDQAGFKVVAIDTSMQEDNIYICLPKGKKT